MKRAFDLVASAAGILILIPVFAVVAAIVRMEDGGPAFFAQLRVGRSGRQFKMWKFRTMVTDAENRGGQLTIGNDPRITKAGLWLRRSKMDELPQLLNVFIGDMSFVGPRPEVPRYVEMYTEPERKVLELTPGITDPASIAFRNESEILAESGDPERTYIERIMPEKIKINLEYAASASVLTDLRVILQTVLVMARGRQD